MQQFRKQNRDVIWNWDVIWNDEGWEKMNLTKEKSYCNTLLKSSEEAGTYVLHLFTLLYYFYQVFFLLKERVLIWYVVVIFTHNSYQGAYTNLKGDKKRFWRETIIQHLYLKTIIQRVVANGAISGWWPTTSSVLKAQF